VNYLPGLALNNDLPGLLPPEELRLQAQATGTWLRYLHSNLSQMLLQPSLVKLENLNSTSNFSAVCTVNFGDLILANKYKKETRDSFRKD
jgi:hypothetical protein